VSELTPYIHEELICVERLIGKLNTYRKEGRCDGKMAATIDHLIDEMLFFRGVLHKHPPYLTSTAQHGIMFLEGDEDTRPG
jgi:hypothetical protein